MVRINKKIRVAVLMGGFSSERNVSLSTGMQILGALNPRKYDAVAVDAALLPGSSRVNLPGNGVEVQAVAEARDKTKLRKPVSFKRITTANNAFRPDVAIVALHGKYGEDGTVQGMLELLGIPYTGSGVLASALAMDKSMAKKVLAADGIAVPPSVDFVCRKGEWDADGVAEAVERLGYPVIVKPSRGGSTIGMTKVDRASELNNAIRMASGYDARIVVEKFLQGIELTVSVLGNDDPFALPVIEIVPAKGWYDYEAKYTPGATEEIVPARIGEAATAEAQRIAVDAHRSLGCRGVSRVDIISGDDRMYVLEVNTIPGMTPTSLLPRAAAAAEISFDKLLDMLVEFALEEGTER